MLRFCRYFFLNFPHKHKSNVSGICILDDILDRACYCDSRGGVCWCSSWHLVSFLLWDKNCLPFMAYFSDYQVCYRNYLKIDCFMSFRYICSFALPKYLIRHNWNNHGFMFRSWTLPWFLLSPTKTKVVFKYMSIVSGILCELRSLTNETLSNDP